MWLSRNKGGLHCTHETTKKLAELTHWKPNTQLFLGRIPEVFNAADFCDLIKKGFFSKIGIKFGQTSSIDYQNNFKAAIEEMKSSWTSEMNIPEISITK